MNLKIENKELAKSIRNCLQGPHADIFSDQELASIENIGLTGRLVNGRETGVTIKDVLLFKNLKYLTLRAYKITTEDLYLLGSRTNIQELSFLQCTFVNTDFDKVSRIPETLKFIGCPQLTEKFPGIKKILVDSCEMDFDSISFSKANIIRIQNSKIKNVHDIDAYDNIAEVNFDGSELVRANGETAENIRVGRNCRYSHKKNDRHYVDNYPGRGLQ